MRARRFWLANRRLGTSRIARLALVAALGFAATSATALASESNTGVAPTSVPGGLAATPANWYLAYNVSTGSSLSYSLQVGGSQQAWITLLTPGTTYYLNVKNSTYTGTQTCPSGSQCNMFLDFYKPPGT